MSRSCIFTLSLCVAFCLSALAQKGTGSTGGGSTGGTGGARSTPTVTPSVPQPGTNNIPNIQPERQILYISGSVVMAQGGPPPEPVAIERVCNGNAHKEGYTDSKGHYQIQLGQNLELQDVSETGGGFGPFGSSSRAGGGLASGSLGGIDPHSLMGCEVRGLLPGFQSNSVMIRVDGSFGEIRMDTIVLQQLGGGQGSTVSLTSMQAPGSARKAYEKAEKDLNKNDLKSAEKELTKAVTEYPKYAAAWTLLGMIQQSYKQVDEANKDFNQAIAADPQYAKPYYGLATIAVDSQNWKETIRFTDELNRLAPLAYPEAYFYSGVANFNLNNMDVAERDIRKFLSLDTEHRRPIAALYLAQILANKQDFAGAAEQARSYLALAPNASNAATVREKIKQMEQLSGTAQKQ